MPPLVESIEEGIEDLSTNALHLSVLQNYTFSNVSMTDEIIASTEEATILANSLKTNSSTADVSNLQINLDTLLEQMQSQNTTAIERLLEHLHDRLSYNATALYRELQGRVATQEAARREFEVTVLALQKQIDYLEHVNSLLPVDCT